MNGDTAALTISGHISAEEALSVAQCTVIDKSRGDVIRVIPELDVSFPNVGSKPHGRSVYQERRFSRSRRTRCTVQVLASAPGTRCEHVTSNVDPDSSLSVAPEQTPGTVKQQSGFP